MIVGASSGIGRATAHEFARSGARLVLAARSETSLETVRSECEALGAQAVVVPTDVTSDEQVQALVDAAVARFGRIDVWVGAAAAFAFGTFEQLPASHFRQLMDVNLFGQERGARAVLPQLRRQGGGTIVFIGSLFSRVSTPYVSAYITSKHAVLGLADSLRQELRPHGIRVCLVMPASADTPIYQHAANFLRKPARPLPPIIAPERVARAIVRLADRPRPRTAVGRIQALAIAPNLLVPRIAGRLSLWVMNRAAVRKGVAEPHDGTMFAPDPATNAVDGGWRRNPDQVT